MVVGKPDGEFTEASSWILLLSMWDGGAVVWLKVHGADGWSCGDGRGDFGVNCTRRSTRVVRMVNSVELVGRMKDEGCCRIQGSESAGDAE